ncbi:hypothetical protein T484DRAFT_2601247 [Baffinella frigidus]|nr:hypothetical protein T484DRAFT_2601247 [Cryptophyta sp. CCMP2293]
MDGDSAPPIMSETSVDDSCAGTAWGWRRRRALHELSVEVDWRACGVQPPVSEMAGRFARYTSIASLLVSGAAVASAFWPGFRECSLACMRWGAWPRMTRTVTSWRSSESAAKALVLLLAANVHTTAADATCEAGHVVNATVSGGPPGCTPCKAGTYKDSSNASECTACPTNSMSAVGSSSCECAAGYTGDAGAGEDCVPCEAGTFKAASGSATCTACLAGTYKSVEGPGACLSCPGDATSVDGASSCACWAGNFFMVPSLSCSGSCPCDPWVGLNESTISSNSEGSGEYDNNADCTWTISGAKAQVTFHPWYTAYSLHTEPNADFVYVDECDEGQCSSVRASLAVLSGLPNQGLSYESTTFHLRLRFTSNSAVPGGGFTATVSGGPPGCAPCRSGTYVAASNASECTACPDNAVSAVGGTALSSCECPAGYTGDAGSGEDCVPCEAGTFKAASGSATCTSCPMNAVGGSSCVCAVGYTGDAGLGGDCVACDAGTYKDVTGSATCTACPMNAVSAERGSSCECPPDYEGDARIGEVCVACRDGTVKSLSGLGTCQAPTGAKARAWMDGAAGFFKDGPAARLDFGCAEARGLVYLFAGATRCHQRLMGVQSDPNRVDRPFWSGSRTGQHSNRPLEVRHGFCGRDHLHFRRLGDFIRGPWRHVVLRPVESQLDVCRQSGGFSRCPSGWSTRRRRRRGRAFAHLPVWRFWCRLPPRSLELGPAVQGLD